MVGSRVIATVLLTTALAGCGNVPQKTAAQAPVAAAPPAGPAPPTVTTPPIVIVPPFVTAAPPTTDEPTVSTDQFISFVKIKGALATVKASDGILRRWLVYSEVDKKTLSTNFIIRIELNYTDYGDYRYYRVTDDSTKYIDATFERNADRCSVNKCSHHDSVDVFFSEKKALERQNAGIIVKLWSDKDKDVYLQVSPQQIQKQLAEIAAVRQALKDGKL